MLTVPHVLAGAAIGSLVGDIPGQLPIAFVLGWASHYVLDAVPHWERLYHPKDHPDWDTEEPTKNWPRPIFYQAAADVIIAVALLFIAVHTIHPHIPWYQSAVFWGGIGGFFPDIVDNVPFWNRQLGRLSLIKRERQFHQSIHVTDETQERSPKYLGLITQLLVIGGSLWILW